jgi:hypothetical protein
METVTPISFVRNVSSSQIQIFEENLYFFLEAKIQQKPM